MMKKLVILTSLSISSLFGAPTEQRDWKSTAGTTITAEAVKVDGGKVTLKAADGREFAVPLDKFVEEDQEFLKVHFEIKPPEPGQPMGSSSTVIKDGLAHPVGKVSGPIDAGGGSTYFVYVPKSLREGRKAPILFYNSAGRGSANTIQRYSEGAEVNGWVLAVSVESKNGPDHPEGNHEHTKRCLAHLLETLPVDEDRVYFSGNSGGGAMSFYNALRIKSMGNMPFIGYSPDKEYPKGQYCYGIGGTNDYNRYLTANAVDEYGDRGMHRLGVGGHSNGPDWLGDEGITWLNGRYLGDRRKEATLADERLDFEASLIAWIRDLKEKAPYRAHYWCSFLQDEYKISGANAEIVAGLFTELSADRNNVLYTEGIEAIDEFSEKYYAGEGAGGGSQFNHTTSGIESAAKKLAAKYAGVPEIEEVAKKLGEPTVKK